MAQLTLILPWSQLSLSHRDKVFIPSILIAYVSALPRSCAVLPLFIVTVTFCTVCHRDVALRRAANLVPRADMA